MTCVIAIAQSVFIRKTVISRWKLRQLHHFWWQEMHIYTKIYQFAASLGALEGYVYRKKSADEPGMEALSPWINNIVVAYNCFPAEILNEFQRDCDRTAGRAIHSLKPVLGADHDLIKKLETLVKGEMPESADDFNKKKWFEKTTDAGS